MVESMSPEEFLTWERRQPTKHAYLDGEVIEMHGGSLRHNVLTVEAVAILRSALADRGCLVLSSDMRVGFRNDSFAYPDVAVVCPPVLLRPGTNDVLENPSLVLEVLSKS